MTNLDYSKDDFIEIIDNKLKKYPNDKLHTIYELCMDNDLDGMFDDYENNAFSKVFDEYIEMKKAMRRRLGYPTYRNYI